ncbi:MAG: tetraacyldisaccharide 4'-kinase [Acidibrevibacterium sp.]|jgi:tetraacyldisaccharide 4'-kinase|uniref:tetraacyldisaccharide 4'-kinase n=1 Tax=Acidibrevibacterium fodinaquatile TaxID=1969806 RepID=UPI0023A7ED38|nr:tetraacyldisaccharide 4'-kinase [Acidibrevibacterium fodinaquatile]MCA7117954.1 tetraacyldisaccharide 4'-kinase [Acidibrevibacterium fodinaquatile]
MRLRPPAFWAYGRGGLAAHLLAPVAALVASAARLRAARKGWRAPVPVLCIGNATLGGAGKTTLALDLGARLRAGGIGVHFLTRGYGGRVRGVRRVAPWDDAAAVGDEPKLLASVAPTWVGADRAASARAAIAAGAELLLMDDGLQNPSLEKTLSLLVIDGASGFGNGLVVPAGPLRERVADAAERVAAAVLIGDDRTGALARLPPALPVLRARLAPGPGARALAGVRVHAIAGIARPEKFHATLAAAGAILVGHSDFPDHHRFTAAELERALTQAARNGAQPVTTPKDATRLPPAFQKAIAIADVDLVWDEPDAIAALLGGLAAKGGSRGKPRGK